MLRACAKETTTPEPCPKRSGGFVSAPAEPTEVAMADRSGVTFEGPAPGQRRIGRSVRVLSHRDTHAGLAGRTGTVVAIGKRRCGAAKTALPDGPCANQRRRSRTDHQRLSVDPARRPRLPPWRRRGRALAADSAIEKADVRVDTPGPTIVSVPAQQVLSNSPIRVDQEQTRVIDAGCTLDLGVSCVVSCPRRSAIASGPVASRSLLDCRCRRPLPGC